VAPTAAADPSFGSADGCTLPLLGLALPWDDGEFDAAVIPDLRGLLPEALVCRVFQEAARVARRLRYLRLDRLPPRAPLVREELLATFDRPYWERTHYVSRHYHDWRAADRHHLPRPGVTVLEVEPVAARLVGASSGRSARRGVSSLLHPTPA
jgi:hypothetical protein